MGAATLFSTTWNGSVIAGTPIQLISANRWGYLRVTNTATAGNLYVTTDGTVSVTGLTLTGNTTPAAGTDLGWTAEPGETIDVASRQALWFQGFGGPNGNIDGVGLNNYQSYDPPQTATPASAPNPGTGITLVSGTGTIGAVVEGVG